MQLLCEPQRQLLCVTPVGCHRHRESVHVLLQLVVGQPMQFSSHIMVRVHCSFHLRSLLLNHCIYYRTRAIPMPSGGCLSALKVFT
jgi:hypothetical protein